jgi:hypothetical protein
MNLSFIFLIFFFLLGFVFLIAHLQPLFKTSCDLRKLKSWVCMWFCWPYRKKLKNFKP